MLHHHSGSTDDGAKSSGNDGGNLNGLPDKACAAQPSKLPDAERLKRPPRCGQRGGGGGGGGKCTCKIALGLVAARTLLDPCSTMLLWLPCKQEWTGTAVLAAVAAAEVAVRGSYCESGGPKVAGCWYHLGCRQRGWCQQGRRQLGAASGGPFGHIGPPHGFVGQRD